MSTSQICLASHLDTDTLLALAQTLCNALAEKTPLLLDGSKVQSIDGATLQLLLAAGRSAQQSGIPFHWHQSSPALERAAVLLGIHRDLQLGENKE